MWHISSSKMGGLGAGHPDKCRQFFRIIIRLVLCVLNYNTNKIGAFVIKNTASILTAKVSSPYKD